MYVNTLISLQENIPTYGVEGKTVTGHVIISTPGIIKCYVQNLKRKSNRKFELYGFSSKKNTGIKIGELGEEKETKWRVDENSVMNSSLAIEDIDGVAIIVNENEMRSVDAILIGFKESRFSILPILEKIKPKGKTKKQDCIKKEIAEEPGPAVIQKKEMPQEGVQKGPGPVIIPEEIIPKALGPLTIPEEEVPEEEVPEEPGPVIIPEKEVPEEPGPVIIPEKEVSEEPGPVIIRDEEVLEEPGPVIISEEEVSEEPGPVIIRDEEALEESEPVVTPEEEEPGEAGTVITSDEELSEESQSVIERLTNKIKDIQENSIKQREKASNNIWQLEIDIANHKEENSIVKEEIIKEVKKEEVRKEEMAREEVEDDEIDSISSEITSQEEIDYLEEIEKKLQDIQGRLKAVSINNEEDKMKEKEAQKEVQKEAQEEIDYLEEIEKNLQDIQDRFKAVPISNEEDKTKEKEVDIISEILCNMKTGNLREIINQKEVQEEVPKEAQEEIDYLEEIEKKLQDIQGRLKAVPVSNEEDKMKEKEVDIISDILRNMKTGNLEEIMSQKEIINQKEVQEEAQEANDKVIDEEQEQNVRIQNVRKTMQEIYAKGEVVEAFIQERADTEWVKIPYEEFLKIPTLQREWCTQPFITFALYKYNEILLGRTSNEKYYLGIPDIYHPERKGILSNPTPVETFLCRRNIEPVIGEYGYWIIPL